MSLSPKEEDELIQLLELEQIDKAKTNYYDYVKYTHRNIYTYTRHGEYICNIINNAIEKRKKMLSGEIPLKTQYLKFSMPPQHGKSMHITETLPSYFLGQFPNEGVIEISYNDTFASKFGARNRDKIKEYGNDLFGIGIAKDSNAKGEWDILDADGKKTRGGMISRGVLSGITGSSLGDCIIIDDPIKNREEANSEVYRQKIWDEWMDSISTRIHPGAIVIVILTRWHEDDLWGRLDDPEHGNPLPWENHNLPLEAEENDLLGREIGEPLWPDRYDKDFVEERKQYPASYNSLYQGRPTSQEGNLIKRHWWRYWKPKGVELPPVTIRLPNGDFTNVEAIELPDNFDTQIQSWDMTFKDSDGTDFVVGGVWASKGANIFALDKIRNRMDFVNTVSAFEKMTSKWPKATAKLVEDKANGPAIISMLRKKIHGIIPIKPEGSKLARASAVTDIIESGNVYLPHPQICNWTNEFVEECASFPKGAHDDYVDEMSQALKRLMYARENFEDKNKRDEFLYRDEEETYELDDSYINMTVRGY